MPSNRAIEHRNRVLGFLLLPIAFFVLVSLITYSVNDYPNSSIGPDEVLNAGGRVGALIASTLVIVCGYGAYGIPVIITLWGWIQIQNNSPWWLLFTLVIGLSLIITGTTTIGLITTWPADLRFEYGGALGLRFSQLATEQLGVDKAFYVSIITFAGLVLTPLLWGVYRQTNKRRTEIQISDEPASVPHSSF